MNIIPPYPVRMLDRFANSAIRVVNQQRIIEASTPGNNYLLPIFGDSLL
jgi:hypothetical protein